MGVPDGEDSANLSGRGAKIDVVPVPVLCREKESSVDDKSLRGQSL